MLEFLKRILKRDVPRPTKVAEKGTAKAEPQSEPVFGDASGTILRFHADLFDRGKERAIASGDYHFNEATAKSLGDLAESMGREKTTVLLNSLDSRHDAELEEQNAGNKVQLGETNRKITAATEKVNLCRDGLANRGEPAAEPETPIILIIAFSVAIGASLFPTFIDYIFGSLTDRRMAFVFSGAASLVLGFALSWFLAGSFKSSHRSAHIIGFAGGIVCSIGFFLIRLYGVESSGDMFFAVGLAAFELSAIAILESKGCSLRSDYALFVESRGDYVCAVKRLAAAERELELLLADRARFEGRIAEFVRHVREREHLFRQIENLVNSARKTILDGYRAGLAELEGRIRGQKSSKRTGDK